MQTSQAKAPISAHPLFPAVVALWFAALFGLGSGVLPNLLFERLVTVSGISSLVPAAAPPLGPTFRILISIAAALAGGAAGFVLARRLAAAHYVERPGSVVSRLSPQPDPVPQADTRRRPISVKDDLDHPGLEAIESDERTPARRRSLARAEDEHGSEFFAHAPLPTAGHQPASAPQQPPMDQPLDLASFTPEPEPELELAPRIETEASGDSDLPDLGNRPLFTRPLGDEDEEPVSFDAPAFAAPVAAPGQQIRPGPEPAPAPLAVKPVLPTDPDVDLADLGMVQLAERLGASIRTRPSRPAAPADFVARLKRDFGIESSAGTTPDAVAPGSAIFGQAGFAPAASAVPPAWDGEEHSDEIGEAEENYSSLLGMKSPARTAAPVETAESPEPRPFDAPGASGQRNRPGREETERVLRSALTTLQRMSGTA